MVGDVWRAAYELGIARLRLGSHPSNTLIDIDPKSSMPLDPAQSALVDRVALAIPGVAARLPWRADCLIQALAARRWLGRNGIATTLSLGVPKDMPAKFEAHAWLKAGDTIVTGGDIGNYVPLRR